MKHAHPLTLTSSSILSPSVPDGTTLRRLRSNSRIRPGDFMTAWNNPPGSGLLPVYYYQHDKKISSSTELVFYRPTSTTKANS